MHGLETQLLMRHFAAAELQGELHLVPIGEELACLFRLDHEIVSIDLRAQPNFLELAVLAVTAGLLLFFALLVFPLAEVHDSAYRRGGIRGDFYQVQTSRTSPTLGVIDLDNTNLLVVFIDQANG